MIATSEAIQRLVLHEGCRLQPYRCSAGYLTVGVGRNLDTNPLTPAELKVCGDWRRGISKNAAFCLLKNDIERAVKDCERYIPFFGNLDAERQYALVDMCFNLGISGLLKFKKMLSAMGVGNYIEAAAECLSSSYARQTGKRAQRIAILIKTGEWLV